MSHPKRLRASSSSSVPAARSVRVRSRPLDQIDEAKLALALAMMAKRLREARQSADEAAESEEAA